MEKENKIKLKSCGFTIIELMVTLAIMVSLFTVVITGIAGQRSNRNLGLATNELVTNIRKMQTNVLVSKGISDTQSAQYYILRFDSSKPTQYTLQAIYNSSSQPVLTDLETIKLPTGVRFASSNPFNVYRTGYSNYPSCALLVFKAPFAKVLTTTACNPSSPVTPYTILSSDDYYSIVNFVTNGATVVNSDSSLDIVLSNDSSSKTQTVTVKGVSGLVTSQ